MASRLPSRSRRLATAAAWPAGILLTSWHYMWRITPLHRRELPGSPDADAGPDLPAGLPGDGLQPAGAGVGPLYHRRYRARIAEPRLGAPELMARVSTDLNSVAPTEFARFTKVGGDEGRMAAGDEYVVRMPGPWDGPVRVVDVTPTSFRLITLDGHLEAGQIEFRAAGGEDDTASGGDDDAASGGDDDGEDGAEVVFTIESWGRSGDRLSLLMYQVLHMAKEVQLHMWTSFLERVAASAGGRLAGGIDVETRVVDCDDPAPEPAPEPDGRGGPLATPEARRLLDELHQKGLNFDLAGRDLTAGAGWVSDDYCQRLSSEPPGPPVPGGSWEVAQALVRNYEFADPDIVRAVYHPERPLEGRDMLLEVRFYGLRFRFGVRVGGVVDEVRDVDGRQVRIWGWNYRTLQGHLEMGQMDYEVWKWLDTGEVEFHTCRFSRRAPAGNPVVRLGVRIFGRHQQVKFARHACERMARLSAAALSRTT